MLKDFIPAPAITRGVGLDPALLPVRAAGLDAAKKNINGDADQAYGLVHILTQPREAGGCGDLSRYPHFEPSRLRPIGSIPRDLESHSSWTGPRLQTPGWARSCGTSTRRPHPYPATGLTSLKLIRADYDPATLPEFKTSFWMHPKSPWLRPPDQLNRVVIRYVDRSQVYTVRTAQDQDAGNYWARGEGGDTTLDFMGLSYAALAQYVAAREIRVLASPLAKGTLQFEPEGLAAPPRLSIQALLRGPDGWSGLVCRVTNIRDGTLGAGKITVEFAQDVFAVGVQAYAPPAPGGWIIPRRSAPFPCAAQAMMEAPHWVTGEAEYVLAMGARADQITIGAETGINQGSGYLLTGLLDGMTPTGLLTAAYSAKDRGPRFCRVHLERGLRPLQPGASFHQCGWSESGCQPSLVPGHSVRS